VAVMVTGAPMSMPQSRRHEIARGLGFHLRHQRAPGLVCVERAPGGFARHLAPILRSTAFPMSTLFWCDTIKAKWRLIWQTYSVYVVYRLSQLRLRC
jgi:hypothetical protein